MAQSFVCQQCHRKHTVEEAMIDGIITCECGYRFYCFGNSGMTITMPVEEIRGKTRDLMRRFVQSTGRCRDAPSPPSETGNIMQILQRMDSRGLLEIALKKIQEEDFGETLLHSNDIVIILELLNENKDAVVKGQKGHVNVMEQRNRNCRKSETDYLQLVKDTLAPFEDRETVCREETPLKQWQIDIMEENARRTGLLFGESG